MKLPKVTDDPAFLFMLRVGLTNKEHGNRVLSVTAWENYKRSIGQSHTYIDVRAREHWTDSSGKRRHRTIFKRGDTYCGVAGHSSIDGDEARELVLSLVAMKPGDTDEDYFASYTPKQLAFVSEWGDAISCEAEDRYSKERGR